MKDNNKEELCALVKATLVVPKAKDMVLDVAENNNTRNNYTATQADIEADMALINAVPVMEPYDY